MRANCSRLEKAKTRLEEELSYEKSKGKKLKKSVDKLESEKRKLLKLNDEVKSESKLSKHELFKIREEKESEKKINEEKKLNDKLEELEKKIQPDEQKQTNINQIDPNLLEQVVLVDFQKEHFQKDAENSVQMDRLVDLLNKEEIQDKLISQFQERFETIQQNLVEISEMHSALAQLNTLKEIYSLNLSLEKYKLSTMDTTTAFWKR